MNEVNVAAGVALQNQIVTQANERLAQRIQELDAQLAAVTAERDALRDEVGRFGADQWRNGNAGREPQEFEEWRSSHD